MWYLLLRRGPPSAGSQVDRHDAMASHLEVTRCEATHRCRESKHALEHHKQNNMLLELYSGCIDWCGPQAKIQRFRSGRLRGSGGPEPLGTNCANVAPSAASPRPRLVRLGRQSPKKETYQMHWPYLEWMVDQGVVYGAHGRVWESADKVLFAPYGVIQVTAFPTYTK